jgi:cobalt-zinc-cadmium efflux system protein
VNFRIFSASIDTMDHSTEHVHHHHPAEDHSHNHSHGHGHHHHAQIPKHITRAFVIGILLNASFVVAEVIGGFYTHSLALLTDAGHNLSDVASLGLAWFATRYALKKSSKTFTFGYKQSTVLVALLNACILLLALGAVAYEAILRLIEPHALPVEGKTVAYIATAGIVINTITALLFMREKDKDLNMRGAYLHMASDALVSLGVVVGGIIMLYTHWFWIDAAISLAIAIVIVYGTWGLLRESLRLSLNGVPTEIDLQKVYAFFKSMEGIAEVHDLHVWALSTTENALTVHLVVPGGVLSENFYTHVREELKEHYHIGHSTIQIESNKDHTNCGQDC